MSFLSHPERRPLILLTLGAFLAPLMGGAVPIDPQPLGPGELLSALFSNPAAATLSQTLLFVVILGAGVWAAATRKVLPVPQNRIAIPFLVVAASMFVSFLASGYKFASLGATAYVLGILATLFVVVMLAGREQGILWVLGGLVTGTTLVAALGIREYVTQIDPNWRIFSIWMNPNALAGMLIFGFFGGLVFVHREHRLGRLLGGLACLLCATSSVLSGSKGGLLGIALGVLLVTGFMALRSRKAIALAAVLFLAAGFGFTKVLSMQVAKPAPPVGVAVNSNPTAAPAPRLASAGSTAEQSVGFRVLLWKGALDLAKERPVGWGMGTYRFQSTRPGLNTQTQTAHSSYLQLAVEGGVIAALALVFGCLLIVWESLKGSSKQPLSMIEVKAPLLGGLVAAAVHNGIDSDLYSPGTGIGLMIFLGLALLTSADGIVPEYRPKIVRPIFLVSAALALLGVAWVSRADMALSRFAYAANSGGDRATLEAAISGVEGFAQSDPRAAMILSQVSRARGEGAEAQEAHLRRAIALGPTPSMHRQLARFLSEKGDKDGAVASLKRALEMDRYNLPALALWLELEADDPELGVPVAERLVAVEDTGYFKTRSLPELVPIETYDARLYLARQSKDPAEREKLLEPALAGYAEFAKRTIPEIAKFASVGMDGGFGGLQTTEGLAILGRANEALTLFESAGGDGSSYRPVFSEALARLSK